MQRDKVCMSDLDNGLQEYLNHLRMDYAKNGYNNKEFYYELGRKYVHIIMSDNQRSSHSWVMLEDDKKFRRGDILKSASWKAPARNFARGNVLTRDFKTIRWCGV
jgi:hypothetical protein